MSDNNKGLDAKGLKKWPKDAALEDVDGEMLMALKRISLRRAMLKSDLQEETAQRVSPPLGQGTQVQC